MILKTLAEAEKFVKRSRGFTWEGWDIVHLRPHKEAFKKVDGVYKFGRWHRRTVIKLDRDGFHVPDYLCRP